MKSKVDTQPQHAGIIVGCTALLCLIAGMLLSNLAWHVWHRKHHDPQRNYFAIRAWKEYLDPATYPGVTAPTLLLANSQGYGTEWPVGNIYATRWNRTPRLHGDTPWTLLNWSVAGGLFADQFALAAAAARFQPERIVAILSPHTFVAYDPAIPHVQRWASDAYFALADPRLRERIPPIILDDVLDPDLRADLRVGSWWSAWRMRRAVSDRLTDWLRNEPERVAAAIEPYPRQPPPFDPAKAHAYLDLLRAASTNVTMIHMPLHSAWRQSDRTSWNTLTTICREKGIRALDLSDAIPDEEFLTASHLNREGHQRMARLLHEQVP